MQNIVFGEINADIVSNKKLNPIVTELCFLVFIAVSNFSVQKILRLNSTYYSTMKIQNKQELQDIALNHSSDIKQRL